MRKVVLAILFVIASATICQSQHFNQQRLDSLFDMIENNDRGMGNISLFKDGKEIYRRSYGYSNLETKAKNNAGTRFRIGSISKTFTAVIIMKLIENKQLSLDTKLSTFYPQLESADKITIQQLLQHRSGIFNLTNAEDYASGWHKNTFSKKDLLDKIASRKNIFEADTKVSYSNSNYILLSFIAEDITKKDFSTLLNEYIVTPIGLTNTFLGKKIDTNKNEAVSYNKLKAKNWVLEVETDMSIPLGAGGIVSTPHDLNTFFYALMNGKLLTEASVQQMKTLRDNVGLGLFPVAFFNRQGVGHSGGIDGFISFAAYDPAEKVNIAITSNAVQFSFDSIITGVLSIYFNQYYKLPVLTKALEPSIEELNQYIGTYASSNFPLKITISLKENTLMAQATGQSSFPLECYEKDKFKFDAAGLKLLFNPSENKMTLQQGGREFVLTKE